LAFDVVFSFLKTFLFFFAGLFAELDEKKSILMVSLRLKLV